MPADASLPRSPPQEFSGHASHFGETSWGKIASAASGSNFPSCGPQSYMFVESSLFGNSIATKRPPPRHVRGHCERQPSAAWSVCRVQSTAHGVCLVHWNSPVRLMPAAVARQRQIVLVSCTPSVVQIRHTQRSVQPVFSALFRERQRTIPLRRVKPSHYARYKMGRKEQEKLDPCKSSCKNHPSEVRNSARHSMDVTNDN